MGGDLLFLAALGTFPKFGPKRLPFLLRHFGSPEAVWLASESSLAKTGFTPELVEEFLSHRAKTFPEKVWQELQEKEIRLLTLNDPDYPLLLKEISNPPFLLYLKGNLPPLGPALGVVGTRRATSYGLRVTKELITPLARQGVAIISGLAQGIDAAAHQATLVANGYTIAVVAFGLQDNLIYPPQHKKLFHHILETGGGILSEFPLATPALPHLFLQRNRLIAGLAKATLVIEAPESSGALSTAAFALDWNREVLSVPGPVTHPNHTGTNRLIQRGATLVTCADDICNALNWQNNNEKKPSLTSPTLPNSLSLLESKLWSVLSEERHINELVLLTHLNMSDISATLTLMQMKGIVNSLPGQRYDRV